MTKERLGAVLATLAVALPGKELSNPLLEVYWRALSDLSDADLEAAGTKALRACRFFPTPSELLELAQPRNLAAEAGRVFERIKEMADYSPRAGSIWSETKIRLALGDEAADAYQAAGGAAALRTGDEVWTRKAFVEAYQEHPPTDNPLLRIGSGDTKKLPAGDARVLEMTSRIGRTLTASDQDQKRRDFKSAAAKDE